MRYVSVTALVFLLCISSLIGAEGVVAYEGVSDCGSMRLTVRFNYDRDAAKIRDFVAEHSCIDGKGGLAWKGPEEIAVADDGSFSYRGAHGNTVSGQIDGSGMVKGELSKGLISVQCADEKFHPMCTAFMAKPKSE